jgi:hypothetical protein
MTRAYWITLLLLALLPALRQESQPVRLCRLETKYDRAADLTTVQCGDLIEREETPAKLTVQANVSFRGRELNETAKFWLSLSSHRSGAARRSQLLFQEATVLYLVTDAARLEIQVTDYRKDFFELVSLMAESARAEIGREDLRKLLEAKRLTGRWGNVEFKFSDAAVASLKGFISRQVLVTPTR